MTKACAMPSTDGCKAWTRRTSSHICRCSGAALPISTACSASACSMRCSAAPAPACLDARPRPTPRGCGRRLSGGWPGSCPRGPPMRDGGERRWRLALGGEDEQLDTADQRLSNALTALYGEGDTEQKKSRGSLGGSAPNVARWMKDVRQYFP